MTSTKKHIVNQSLELAYNQTTGAWPGVVFLCGHGSDMQGNKALFLEQWALQRGISFLRFDYSGHGQSGGKFLETNISDWTRDTIGILDNLTNGPQILVGSSLGGWLMLNVALKRPERIAALVGIAAAPDFTEDLIWNTLNTSEKAAFEKTGKIDISNPYSSDLIRYPYHLIQDGRKHLKLRNSLPILKPVRLVHGLADAEVPWETSVKLATCLESDDVIMHFDKAATHRFSEESHLSFLAAILDDLVEKLKFS